MEKTENFAENYYPSDIFSNNNAQNQNVDMNKNTQVSPPLSMENIINLIGGNENLASLLLSKNLKNNEKFENLPINNPIFELLKQNKSAPKTTKEEIIIDQNSFEEY